MKMCDEERKEFDELYYYVKDEILGEDKAVPKYMVLRLKGLHEGKFMANKNTTPMASYDYSTILLTFKFCKYQILSKSYKEFKDEQHKFNYMMAVVEANINDMVDRVKNVKKAQEKGESINVSINEDKATYRKKTKSTTNEKLKHLW